MTVRKPAWIAVIRGIVRYVELIVPILIHNVDFAAHQWIPRTTSTGPEGDL